MLFNTAASIAEYAAISTTVDMATMKPTLVFVSDQHILPILGKELYNRLHAEYASSDTAPLSQPMEDLLEKCRKVIGPYFCYYFAPKSDVQLSDSGVQRIETNTNKTAYQYQTTNFLQANLREAETATEALLEFLEENKGNYAEWTNSAAFTQYRSLFIKSGKELQELYASHTPYRNYFAIRFKMFDVEENIIRELLGTPLFDQLKTKDLAHDGTFTAPETVLLKYIKKAIAYYTIAFALPFLNARIDSNGLSVIAAASFSQNEKDNSRSTADSVTRTEVIRACTASGNIWIKQITQYLKEQPLIFSTWPGNTPVTRLATTSPNDALSASFGFI